MLVSRDSSTGCTVAGRVHRQLGMGWQTNHLSVALAEAIG